MAIPGYKQKWSRPVAAENWEDLFSVSTTAAEKLDVVTGKQGVDKDGNNTTVVEAESTAGSLTLTEYAHFPIRSKIWHVVNGGNTVLYVKTASSTPAVAGDWDVISFSPHT